MEKTIKDLDIYISDGNYSSKYPRSEEFVEEGIPFIRGNNMVDGDISDDEMYYITPEKHAILLKGHVKAGDVLITTRGNIGQVAIVPERHEDSNINAQIVLLRTNPESLYNRYLLWALQSHRANEQYIALQTGTALKQLPVGKLEKLSIKVADIDEQHDIANTLDKVYEVIKERRKELLLLDDLIKARFVEMFGDPVQNTKRWNTDTCKNLTSKIGSGATPKGGRESYGTEGISLIRSMNVYNNRFEYKDLAYITDEQADKLSNVTIEEKDVLLNITGASVARCCVVPKELIPARVNQHVAIVRCKDRLLPEFLCGMFTEDSYQRLLWSIATSGGATREAITKQQIEDLVLIVPPIELQQQFVDFCKQVDKSKLIKIKIV